MRQSLNDFPWLSGCEWWERQSGAARGASLGEELDCLPGSCFCCGPAGQEGVQSTWELCPHPFQTSESHCWVKRQLSLKKQGFLLHLDILKPSLFQTESSSFLAEVSPEIFSDLSPGSIYSGKFRKQTSDSNTLHQPCTQPPTEHFDTPDQSAGGHSDPKTISSPLWTHIILYLGRIL